MPGWVPLGRRYLYLFFISVHMPTNIRVIKVLSFCPLFVAHFSSSLDILAQNGFEVTVLKTSYDHNNDFFFFLLQ